MGEAMPEGTVYTHPKAWALLEVVRLAFEGGIGFGSADPSCVTKADDEAHACVSRNKQKGKAHVEQHAVHPSRPASTGSSSRLVPGGPCTWCGVTATPQWRRPRGTNKLLCNACGIFFTRYGRLPEKSQHLHAVYASPPPAVSAPSSSAGPIDASIEATLGLAVPEGRHEPQQEGGRTPEPAQRVELQPDQQPQNARPSTSTSSLAGASPHKRKEAPQPEVELLRCLEDSAGSIHGDSGAAPPTLTSLGLLAHTMSPPQPALCGTLPYQYHQQHLLQAAGAAQLGAGDTSSGSMAAGLAASAAAGSLAAQPNVLAVAPLDLGWQKLHMQQLGLLGQRLDCLAALPSLCLQGSSTAGGSLPACVSMLSPELLAYPPFALPTGLPPVGLPLLESSAMAGGLQGQHSRDPYSRPSKRQERLHIGESDDSNVSTDSHAATHVDASNSHDEGEGGVTPTAMTTTTTTSAITVAAGGGLSCSPTSLPGLHFPTTLFSDASALPLLPSTAGPGNPCRATESSSAATAGGGSGVTGAGAGQTETGFVPGYSAGPANGDLGQQPVILLQARRSKGPRSRASSATPSSSAVS